MNKKHAPHIAVLCLIFITSNNITLANNTPSRSNQYDSTISQYISGTPYNKGDRVINFDKYYECTNSTKCAATSNEPGAKWKYAWKKVSKKVKKQLDKNLLSDYISGNSYSPGDYVGIGKKVFQCQPLPNGEKCKSSAYQPKSKEDWKSSWKRLSSNQVNSSSSSSSSGSSSSSTSSTGGSTSSTGGSTSSTGGSTSSTGGSTSSTGGSTSSSGGTNANSAIEQALTTGNALLVKNSNTYLNEILKIIKKQKKSESNFLKYIYGNDSIHYETGGFHQYLSLSKLNESYALMTGNNKVILAAVSDINGQRNAAYGTSIIMKMLNMQITEHETHFSRLINWLLHRNNPNSTSGANIKLVAFRDWDNTQITSWFAQFAPKFNVSVCNEPTDLEHCLVDNTDLIITGSKDIIADDILLPALKKAQNKQISFLYNHTEGNNSTELTHSVFALMDLSIHYNTHDTADWSDYLQMQESLSTTSDIERLITHFKNNSFTIDLSSCFHKCEENDNYSSQFLTAVRVIKNKINKLDQSGIDVFNSENYRLEKLLILLGDYYRQNVQFPMDKITTDTTAFLESLYADHTVFNYRSFAPGQPDMGNFSRSDFSHITPVDKTIHLSSKDGFRSAGVYALPGQTFEIKRLDNNALETSVFVNTIRSSSTHPFEENGYRRPKFLDSEKITIEPGETLKITSVHGGPIQIQFNKADIKSKFFFKNIGLHPYWNGEEDNYRFLSALDANEYDWAEIATPTFEVHSKPKKLIRSLNDKGYNYWPDISGFTRAIIKYTSDYPFSLAAMKGPGISRIPEVDSFASEHGLNLKSYSSVKHMNSDQSSCSNGGCSGNPYDAYWSFSPINMGDLHEMGHSFQRGLLKFSDWTNHSMTNYYGYYTNWQYHKQTGNEPRCHNLPFAEMETLLLNSLKSRDPFKFMQNTDTANSNFGSTVYIQIIMAAQADGALKDGWHLFPRLHLLERAFSQARNNEEDWLAIRDNIGFDHYSQDEAKKISSNDFASIAISYAASRDYRQFLRMWGLGISDKAAQQIASFRFRKMPTRFYQAEEKNYCRGLDKPSIKIKL